MFRLCRFMQSRPQRQHFRKKIPGFYSAYYGASFMKSYPVIPYERKSPSLFHYPEVSTVTGKKINWIADKPTSGYEGCLVYGDHTLELTGLPMGKTPEYLQERLRRYFSKFGVVTVCRAINHPLDPYQCEGRAFVGFREASACENAAAGSVIRMGTRVLTVRHILSDKVLEGRSVIAQWRRDLESTLAKVNAQYNGELVEENESWSDFLAKDCQSLFVNGEPRVLINFEKEFAALRRTLEQRIEDKLTQPWRKEEAVKLPKYTQRRIDMWDKKDKLPFDLEVLSRDFRQHRIHDEKFLIASRKKRRTHTHETP